MQHMTACGLVFGGLNAHNLPGDNLNFAQDVDFCQRGQPRSAAHRIDGRLPFGTRTVLPLLSKTAVGRLPAGKPRESQPTGGRGLTSQVGASKCDRYSTSNTTHSPNRVSFSISRL